MRYNPNAHPVDIVLQFLPDSKDMSPGSEYSFVVCALQLLRDVDDRNWRPGYGDNPLNDVYARLNDAGIEDNTDAFIRIRDQLSDLYSKWSDPRRPGPVKRYTKLNRWTGRKCGGHGDDCVFEYVLPMTFCDPVCQTFPLSIAHVFC